MVTLREKARQAGVQWYKSDSTCVHGHKNPVRYTMTGGCKTCLRIKYGNYDKADWESLDPHYKPKGKGTVKVAKKPIKKVRKRTTTVKKACTCNSNDYRRTVKKWIKDKVAAW